MRRVEFDVVVVGGGPAGLAAARRARECGARVGLLDDNPRVGGQIWRGESRETHAWTAAKYERLTGARVVAAPETGVLTVEQGGGALRVEYRKLILATGARERFLPFPGWTLPNVMGAGGLQALAKSGFPIAGKNVVVAGSGPLLLAVGRYLKQRGARVRVVAEQTSWRSLLRFGVDLLAFPGKLMQAIGMAGVPLRTSCWVVAAEGDGRVEQVRLRQGERTWTEPCDYLACGFGLIPNVELALGLGCQVGSPGVSVDENQQTSVAGVYAAGEVTGVGGLDLALAEGEVAGYAAGGDLVSARTRRRVRDAHLAFAQALEKAYLLRDELRQLAADETLVCRCEDVALGRLKRFDNWREAKLQTRCGMGPCQGRICGGATEFLFGWKPESTRPPVLPARLDVL